MLYVAITNKSFILKSEVFKIYCIYASWPLSRLLNFEPHIPIFKICVKGIIQIFRSGIWCKD